LGAKFHQNAKKKGAGAGAGVVTPTKAFLKTIEKIRQKSRIFKLSSPDLESLLVQVAKQHQDYNFFYCSVLPVLYLILGRSSCGWLLAWLHHKLM